MRILPLFAILAATSAQAATPTDTATALCDGKAALPLEVAGSRHFLNVELKTPRGTTETVRFHVDSGGSMFGLLIREAAIKPD